MSDTLITGGTGSFGNAMAKRLLRTPGFQGRLIIYSRDEVKQWRMRSSMDDQRLRWFIGDVRDQPRLRRALEGVSTVIHAAALKRIEVGHYNPLEMVKTNVLGSMNVIEAAMDAKVQRVVALSTDKAYQPVSPYGYSKAMAESLFLQANHMTAKDGPRFAVTRYGNVAGSTGSVIPIWREMIAAGATEVPVTDPQVTRFWMTMDQAVDLVLQAVNALDPEYAIPKAPFIPTLPAYQLGDLARAMGVGMVVGKLPDWEKPHESMSEGNCSRTANRMTIDELRDALKHV